MSAGKASIRKLLCLAFFQAGWFVCVLSAAAGKPELGAVSILAWVTVYIFTTHDYSNELLLISSALVIGYLFDSALALTGILGFSEQAITTVGSPSTYWMLALWINLAAILRSVLDWLSGRFLMAALLGGIIGPPSYLAGEHLGALHLGESLYLTIACVAVEWALAMPLLIWISDRLSPDSPTSAMGETA
ncbi:MAG: DUF2878 domain-containing protein [Planctomycetota bacterium]|nr:DUF2878 domain-containing protein [Planctomycetota bacterium]MEE3230498.1 DUF2878 domain-containing protein [Planctomycetota bacterium]